MYSSKQNLEKLYLEEQKSSIEIANIFNLNKRTILRKMVKYNIPRRTSVESHLIVNKRKYTSYNVIKLNDIQKQILDGLVLSDGYIKYRGIHIRSYSQACKHKEFLLYIQKVLPLGYTEKSIRKRYNSGHFNNGKIYKSYWLESLGSQFLLEQRKWWYPNGIKIVPKDFKLTPTSLLYWFLGDGSYGYKNKIHKSKESIRLSTECFTKEDNEFLQKQLLKLGIKSAINFKNKEKGSYYIRVSDTSISSFFLLIRKSPVECYKYKWGSFGNSFYSYAGAI